MNTNPYRDRIEPPYLPAQHVGFRSACPQCGARAVKCAACYKITTARGEGLHSDCWGDFRKNDRYSGEPALLTFTHNTSIYKYCSPDDRRRHGFLWLKKCDAPDVHVHQKCERCKWSGVVLVDMSA